MVYILTQTETPL